MTPTLDLERSLNRQGSARVCGIDEVGRGSWAGPVCVGALVPGDEPLDIIDDSKRLSAAKREQAYGVIVNWAKGIGVGFASSREVDSCGLTKALSIAASRALSAMASDTGEPDQIILDGVHNYLDTSIPVTTLVKGDSKSIAVAAASIVAKVSRDRLMAQWSFEFPGFDFEKNAGYPSPRHQMALEYFGPTEIHRKSWGFMEKLKWPAFGAPPSMQQSFF